MTKELRISGKILGALNMPDACPRCFWIKQKVKSLPFQIFPGIFMSIDAYSKRVVHAWFDAHHSAPPWIPELQGAVKYLPVPHWSKFKRADPDTGITVSGAMDDLFVCEDGTHIIPDYKTAKYTANQDKLLPMYEGQLNAYRWVHEGAGNKVRSTPLIYCEPITDDTRRAFDPPAGFSMEFVTKGVQVEMDDALIPFLLRQAKTILDMPEPPLGVDGCKDCAAVDGLVRAL
jgi:hypothetical protein